MATARQQSANRRNASRSSGPRSPAGKRRSSANAVVHGLSAASPVLPGEDPAEWEAFRAGVVADFAPVGTAEAELVHSIASPIWRRRRILRLEVAAAVAPPAADPAHPARLGWSDPTLLTSARERLADAEAVLADTRRLHALVPALVTDADDERVSPDDAVYLLTAAAETVQASRPFTLPASDAINGTAPDFLASLGVPAEFVQEPAGWDGWSAGLVRTGCAKLAGMADWTTGRLFRELLAGDVGKLAERAAAARAAVEQMTAVAQGATAVPPPAALEAILRYEPHLSRQLSAALA